MVGQRVGLMEGVVRQRVGLMEEVVRQRGGWTEGWSDGGGG